MAKRAPEHLVPDWHLWGEVIRTIAPLRPQRRFVSAAVEAALPLPPANPPPPARPRAVAKKASAPAWRPEGRPGKPPIEPGTVIEPGVLKKLGRGRIGIDGRIDLHGMRQAEAHAALSRFIRSRAARGDRTVLVITGKGRSGAAEDEFGFLLDRGVLRTMLPYWLGEPALAPLVAGWDNAAQSHGGQGAFYVRLRPLARAGA